MVQGILRALVSPTAEAERLREQTTWLLVPLFNPDACVNSIFCSLDGCFICRGSKGLIPEILDYVTYFRAFIDNGYPLHTVASFFNLECNEGETVLAPFIHHSDVEVVTSFNDFWFHRLAGAGIPTGKIGGWHTGYVPFRLASWSADVYGTLPLIFEVNDRYPSCRLTIEGLEKIGQSFAAALADFYHEPIAHMRLQTMHQLLARRSRQLARRRQNTPNTPITIDEMINLGF